MPLAPMKLGGAGSIFVSLALAIALLALPAAAAGQGRVRGIDVSRFQGQIDWAKVAASGIDFAFIQASRGSGGDCAVVPNRCGADAFYAENYRRARQEGIRVGAYHRAFADGENRHQAKLDARAEATLFVEQLGALAPQNLLPALDVEQPFGELNARRLRVWVWTWLRRVGGELGQRPLIYTNFSSWQVTGNTTAFARSGHRLWIAHHGARRPMVPAANWDGQGWSIWQHTSSGTVRGIDGPVDKNRLAVPLRKISVSLIVA